MKRQMFVAAILGAALTSTSFGQMMIAGDDFDGGSTNGGFTPMTRMLTPDNTANNADFGASFFDLFGIGTHDLNGDLSCDTGGTCDLPFDVIDESANRFPGDNQGIVPAAKLDKYFVITDVENSQNGNSPNAQGVWTFDITGYNLSSFQMEMANMGRFRFG